MAIAHIETGLAQVERYRGCRDGWQPIGYPRSIAAAERMRDLAQRCLPDSLIRVRSDSFPVVVDGD